ncbi:HlyD family efflux transporter periplasmic adaptor subunit [Leeia sp. TBRC 13508]|uniref:HlyD family efflux transporter periplasmic adaptor subunit n=1 Tax=Leeia speluncae TaxID=2884804 RepID=A0ABS8DB38_9NEIS|nr:HlyD family efflux transporter periplasmic adaptor subunit [Leeia speluncae]MCB6185367.1 HlyD family efflux transporter periplasmic adaptor subunit [Leeia speluncae]
MSEVNSTNPLLDLLTLGGRARQAKSADELAFLLVNDSKQLLPYRQSVFWGAKQGVIALSGVIQPEKNAPYVQSMDRLCRYLNATYASAKILTADELNEEAAADWLEWLPNFVMWLPIGQPADDPEQATGLLIAADMSWTQSSCTIMQEWMQIWTFAWGKFQRKKKHALGLLHWLQDPKWKQKPLHHRPKFILAVLLVAATFFPVRMSVLAQSEIVAAEPTVIRVPLDGVFGQFLVKPNQSVKKGDPLFEMDQTALTGRLDIAESELRTTEAEYRQKAAESLVEGKTNTDISSLAGKVEQKQAELAYLQSLLSRSIIKAPSNGVAVFDNAAEWLGKPVQTGERVLRLANLNHLEIESWLSVSDAIPIQAGDHVTFYPAASPFSSVAATVRYMSFDATSRPEGNYAYRIRATLSPEETGHLGLKGTAKISTTWVPFVYWAARKPLAVIRQTLGL